MVIFNKKVFSVSEEMITVFNRSRVLLEGVECIVFCNREKMIFRKKGLVTVEGENLHLEELGNDNVAVSGAIASLSFDEVRV